MIDIMHITIDVPIFQLARYSIFICIYTCVYYVYMCIYVFPLVILSLKVRKRDRLEYMGDVLGYNTDPISVCPVFK